MFLLQTKTFPPSQKFKKLERKQNSGCELLQGLDEEYLTDLKTLPESRKVLFCFYLTV